MSTESHEIVPKPKVRLRFIDMARSIAILLMLEGHFIEHTFASFKPMVALVKANGTSGNVFFDWWYFMKGFTAPMFFSVTGVVFVYLLARNKEAGFWKIPRVKKGFKRSLELLFWGYMLQLNLRHVDTYFRGEFSDWVYAFHVLQSIGVGIAMLLLIFGLYKLLRVIPLFFLYFLGGTAVFCFYPYLKTVPSDVYFPSGAPQFIQNVIHGRYSVFPIVPWMAFTLYGGMIGALFIRFEEQIKKNWFQLIFVTIGLIVTIYSRSLCYFVDVIVDSIHPGNQFSFVENAWLYSRLGQIITVLGVLMFVERFFSFKSGLFLKVGQNTLPIYVLHVIILYGGLFGYGLNKIMAHSLNGWQSILGAAIFLGIFILFIKYYEFFLNGWQKFWGFVKFWKKKPVEEN